MITKNTLYKVFTTATASALNLNWDLEHLLISQRYIKGFYPNHLLPLQPYAFLNLKSPSSLAAEEAAMFYFTPC